MKKVIILLAALLLITGCTPKSEEGKFIKEYGLDCKETDIAIRYIADEKDLLKQVSNGTHMVLLAHPDEDQKQLVSLLAQTSGHFASVFIYYYDRAEVSDSVVQQLFETAVPYASAQQLSNEKLIVFYVKEGETVSYTVFSEMAGKDEQTLVDEINETLNDMLRDLAPGCNEC